MTVLMDCTGASFGKVMQKNAMNILRMASQCGSDYYPETLGQYFILNPPSFFPFVWGIVKSFIDEKTRNRIIVVN